MTKPDKLPHELKMIPLTRSDRKIIETLLEDKVFELRQRKVWGMKLWWLQKSLSDIEALEKIIRLVHVGYSEYD